VQRAQTGKLGKRTVAAPLALLGVFAALAALLLASRWAVENLGVALPTRAQDFVTLSLSIVVEAMPFVVLGALVSVVIRVFAPTERIFRALLPERPAFRRFSISLLGTFMPVCECGNVPVARGLMARGLSVADSTTFLLAAPIVNPVTLLATAQAFRLDPSIVYIRLLGALFIANLVGAVIALYKEQNELLTKGFQETVCAADGHAGHSHAGHDHSGHAGHGRSRWGEGLVVFRDEASLMLKVLCLGAVIAGLTQVFVPRDVLTALGSHPVYSILAMLALAFIVSICANVDAFFALAYAGTFTAGSIVAFLVFGPMVDIKMLAMMRTTYTTRLLVVITLLVGLSSVLIGLVVNYAL
jgi:uncharacterized protein